MALHAMLGVREAGLFGEVGSRRDPHRLTRLILVPPQPFRSLQHRRRRPLPVSLDLAAGLSPSPPLPFPHQERREEKPRGRSSERVGQRQPWRSGSDPPTLSSRAWGSTEVGSVPGSVPATGRRRPPCSTRDPSPPYSSLIPSLTPARLHRRRWLSPRDLSADQVARDRVLLLVRSKASSFSNLGRSTCIDHFCLEYLEEHKVEEHPQNTKVRAILRSHGINLHLHDDGDHVKATSAPDIWSTRSRGIPNALRSGPSSAATASTSMTMETIDPLNGTQECQ
ncbi:uncharacterized protein LOC119279302 [Triticum dicoccoides]|uniref:uncharacterized protein LOC119279302 n=1 Tax=Triticum dicoccoides TaxID=85692 RepID=UPI00188FEE06|nr:uncharacterized protein LOC119279302 [Triticum dicoccoides]